LKIQLRAFRAFQAIYSLSLSMAIRDRRWLEQPGSRYLNLRAELLLERSSINISSSADKLKSKPYRSICVICRE